MARMSATKTNVGLVFGMLLGGWHFLWALPVAAHLAQPVIDFLFWIRFIKPAFVVEAFEFGRFVVLVLVTVAVGFVFGFCASLLWTRIHKPLLSRDFT